MLRSAPVSLSRRVRSLAPSATLAVTGRAKELLAQGVDVLSFAAGEPDFDTPERIKRAAIQAMEAGQTRYMPAAGPPEAREAIAEKLVNENGLTGTTPDRVVITPGGKFALYLLFQALLDGPGPGEPPSEVLLPTPAWVSYPPQTRLAGGEIVEIPASAEQGFKITPEQIREAVTPNSRVFLFNSPSNPCGVTYTPDEAAALAEALGDAMRMTAPHLVVITDEIYEKLIYGDTEHRSLGSFPEIAERTITVNGLSKAYAMTGWRIGYLAGAGELGLEVARAATKLQGQMTTNVTAFCYPAIRVALHHCAEEVESMRQAFERRGRLVHERLSAMPGLVCPRPTGAFYVFPDVSAHFGKTTPGGAVIQSSSDFAQALLDEQNLAVVPGEDFLGCGPRCVRISFACSDEHIERGMDRLAAFLESLR